MDFIREAIALISVFVLPAIIVGFPLYGLIKRVPVYECFVDGAKEGFQVAVRIIPYLVAILFAIGMFRASGAMDFLVRALNPVLAAIGFPAEVLPNYLKSIGVPFHIETQDTYSIVKRVVPEGKTTCGLCSRLRRGILYRVADELGATKIALGHHRYDILQTLFLNMFFGSKLKACCNGNWVRSACAGGAAARSFLRKTWGVYWATSDADDPRGYRCRLSVVVRRARCARRDSDAARPGAPGGRGQRSTGLCRLRAQSRGPPAGACCVPQRRCTAPCAWPPPGTSRPAVGGARRPGACG